MEYTVRKAENADLPVIFRLYEQARRFMAAHGNPSQWGTNDPDPETIRADLRRGSLMVLEGEGRIHGVFMFRIFEDPTYRVIERGDWHRKAPYGVIHRVAGDGSGGTLQAAVHWAETQIDYLRIDTHEQNLPMQRAIARQGFRPCGIIYTAKGDPRIAYDR